TATATRDATSRFRTRSTRPRRSRRRRSSLARFRKSRPDATVLASGEHEIVAVDQLGLAGEAEQAADFGRGLARDQPRFGAAVVAETPADLLAARAPHGDDVAAVEVALDADDADRQQALAAVAQLRRRAFVDDDGTAQLQLVAHPLLARRDLGRLGDERGAD